MKLSNEQIREFANHLRREEKSVATQEKYLRDVQAFLIQSVQLGLLVMES